MQFGSTLEVHVTEKHLLSAFKEVYTRHTGTCTGTGLFLKSSIKTVQLHPLFIFTKKLIAITKPQC